MSDDDPEREKLYHSTVPQGITDAKKIVFGRTFEDFSILLMFYAICIGLSVFGVISGLWVIGGLVGSTVLAAVLYRSAGDTPVTEHLRAKAHIARLPTRSRMSFDPPDGSFAKRLITDGGRFAGSVSDLTSSPEEIQIWEEEVDTTELTRIKNVYPGFDIIERADGAFITALEVDGTSVFLQSKAKQNQLAAEFGRRAGDVDAEFAVFKTTKPYDVRDHQDAHMDAFEHETVQESPILKALHEDYQENIINDRRVRQTRHREIYVVTVVHPEDVDPRSAGEEMEAEGIGRLKEMFSDDPTHTREELLLREAAFAQLDRQQSKIQRLFSGIDGVSLRPVDYQVHLGELRGHWRGPIDSQPVEVPASPIVPPAGMVDVEKDETGGTLDRQ